MILYQSPSGTHPLSLSHTHTHTPTTYQSDTVCSVCRAVNVSLNVCVDGLTAGEQRNARRRAADTVRLARTNLNRIVEAHRLRHPHDREIDIEPHIVFWAHRNEPAMVDRTAGWSDRDAHRRDVESRLLGVGNEV